MSKVLPSCRFLFKFPLSNKIKSTPLPVLSCVVSWFQSYRGWEMRGKTSVSCWEHQHRIGSFPRIKGSKSIQCLGVCAAHSILLFRALQYVTISAKDAKIPNTQFLAQDIFCMLILESQAFSDVTTPWLTHPSSTDCLKCPSCSSHLYWLSYQLIQALFPTLTRFI